MSENLCFWYLSQTDIRLKCIWKWQELCHLAFLTNIFFKINFTTLCDNYETKLINSQLLSIISFTACRGKVSGRLSSDWSGLEYPNGKWLMEWLLYRTFLVFITSQSASTDRSHIHPFTHTHTLVAEASLHSQSALTSSWNRSHSFTPWWYSIRRRMRMRQNEMSLLIGFCHEIKMDHHLGWHIAFRCKNIRDLNPGPTRSISAWRLLVLPEHSNSFQQSRNVHV